MTLICGCFFSIDSIKLGGSGKGKIMRRFSSSFAREPIVIAASRDVIELNIEKIGLIVGFCLIIAAYVVMMLSR